MDTEVKMDTFISKPVPGAVENDWTDATIILDMKNGLGEKFHFEIEPVKQGEKISLPPKFGDTSFGGKCQMEILLPILKPVK